MVDDILLAKAASIERCLRRIEEEYRGREAGLESDWTRQDSIVLNLQRACEAAIDIAMHLVRERALGLPTESRDAFRFIRDAGIITEALSKRMESMVGFRNIAVHEYQSMRLDVVRHILDERLGDFTDFLASVMPRSR